MRKVDVAATRYMPLPPRAQIYCRAAARRGRRRERARWEVRRRATGCVSLGPLLYHRVVARQGRRCGSARCAVRYGSTLFAALARGYTIFNPLLNRKTFQRTYISNFFEATKKQHIKDGA
ncbi:hypothetical protein P152DRAFT_130933 [Eremomyces bilateralis CBS 781.70]|uniref:Uncharacterized protein n=1 Tax=Eremomyces bilateralis CBS 781.70 TaxID=1392243 RepID=A0A6G1GEU6_9PEZI|nr:uncharacterized protein P152DRAFT_130933 [Eremomyces bilateralis CBS 781.70]KAF1816635.1 hypothetical protein P152DRAFT_130933 [Eremomyces bilateralis CBS 781.70]